MQDKKQQFLLKIKETLKKRDDVCLVFLSGSYSQKSANNLSDVDLWVIFREESALDQALHNLHCSFEGQSKIEKIKCCTPTHFFIYLKNKLQIDLNLTTAAEYYSLQSSNKEVILDATPQLGTVSSVDAADLYFFSIKTLERTVSKLRGKQLHLISRFLNSLRDETLIPLLAQHADPRPTSFINLQASALPKAIQADYLACFAQPTLDSSLQAVKSALTLLKFLGKDFPDIYNREKARFALIEKVITSKNSK